MRTKKSPGFTIIEVMIVLAIAGLILAIVFIAVPQLQRNSRDNQRKNMAARVKTELDSYAGNHSGRYPFANGPGGLAFFECSTITVSFGCNDWLGNYIHNGNVNVIDPSLGADTTIYLGTDASSSSLPGSGGGTPVYGSQVGILYIVVGAKCSQGTVTPEVAGTAAGLLRQYAVVINLDRTGTYYCIDNG